MIDQLAEDAVVTLCHYAGAGHLRLGEQLDEADSRATDGGETRALSTEALYWLMAPGLDWTFDQRTPVPHQRRGS